MENIYLATYSYGYQSGLTMEQMLQKAAEMGYCGVELSGVFAETPADEMNRLLQKYGIEVVSAHVMLDGIEKILPYLKEIGAKIVVVPMVQFATKVEALELARLLNESGKKAAEYGLKLAYHNHTAEFFVDEGKYLLDHVIENTDPQYVSFEVDCGWASAAGLDPAEYIKKHAGRIIAIHVKENSTVIGAEKPRSMKEPPIWATFKFENGRLVMPEDFLKEMQARTVINVAMGTGIVDWKSIKAAAEEQGCKTFIVEREWSYDASQDRLACLKEDFEYLKSNI